MYIEDLFA